MDMVNPRSARTILTILAAMIGLSACSSKPLVPYSTDTPPLALLPAALAGIEDKRSRFREIYCTVLEARKHDLPDYRSCDEALTRVGEEPEDTGQPIDLGHSKMGLVAAEIPGVGWDCIEGWLNYDELAYEHVGQFGFEGMRLKVEGLSGTETNARMIRDGLQTQAAEIGDRPVVLIGYSKGTPDILEAIVMYPELRERIVAVVSVAGAVGGSPVAYDVEQKQLHIMKYAPKADCTSGDGGAIESLRPVVRQKWLAQNPLPADIAYYSLVTYPEPERISLLLGGTYKDLSQIDSRNDGQLLFYDQLIPGSSLLGFINADHWAVVVPIARSHPFVGSTFVDKNDYPREALLEALLRFLEEDLAEK